MKSKRDLVTFIARIINEGVVADAASAARCFELETRRGLRRLGEEAVVSRPCLERSEHSNVEGVGEKIGDGLAWPRARVRRRRWQSGPARTCGFWVSTRK